MANSASIPGLPARVTYDTLYISTVNRASLSLALQIIEPAGAVDDSLSYGQAFKLQALVKNKQNVAGTVGTGQATIQTNELFTLIDTLGINASPQRTFSVGSPFFWWLRVNENAVNNISKLDFLNMLNKNISAKSRTRIIEGSSPKSNKMSEIFEAKKTSAGEAVELAVQIEALPEDENTGKPAFIINDSESKTIYLEQKAEINVTQTSLPNTVSTGQTFEYRVTGEIAGNLINPRAYILVPWAIGQSPDAISLDPENRARLTVSVPENYQGTGQDTFQVFLVGTDANTGKLTAFSPTVDNIITVVAHPVLSLNKIAVSPAYADTSGIISRGQKIIIQLQPGFAEKANPAIDNDSTFFTLVEGDASQSFTNAFEILSWTVKAPKHLDLTTNIAFSFTQMPVDQNSGTSCDISQTQGQVQIPIRVRQKSITVTLENNLLSGEYYSKDSSEDSLLIFTIENSFDDALYVKNLELSFHSNIGEPSEENLFKSSTLARIFNMLHVNEFNIGGNQPAKKSSGYSVQSIDYQLSDTSHNPLTLPFGEEDIIPPNTNRTYLITTDFQENTVSRSFQLVLSGLETYDFDSTVTLDIVDPSGEPIGRSKSFDSDPITVISNNLKDDFYNYPNPFGRGGYTSTIFHFRLETESNVEIRIFTLLGELVRTFKREGITERIVDGDPYFRWDGKNDR
ncbi:MAG: hypothetical protein P8X42_19490, partial [Calditrichaceae bacterium]